MKQFRYFVLVCALLTALVLNIAAYTRGLAQGAANRAALVVQLKDGTVISRCVSFTEPEINGYDLLRRADLKLVVDAGAGGAVCKINNSGCNFPAQTCFCECQDLQQSCVYWMYYHQVDGSWKYAVLGAMGQKVTNGSVNGWVYGAGSSGSGGATPPMLTFDQVCSSVTQPTITATPAAVSTATAMPPVAPSATPLPTPTQPAPATSAPASTAQPSATTVSTPTPTSTQVATLASTATSPATIAAGDISTTQTPESPTSAENQSTAPASGYLAFGVIAVALVAVWLFMRRSASKKDK